MQSSSSSQRRQARTEIRLVVPVDKQQQQLIHPMTDVKLVAAAEEEEVMKTGMMPLTNLWRGRKFFLPAFTLGAFTLLVLLLVVNSAQERSLTALAEASRRRASKWATLDKGEPEEELDEMFRVCHSGWNHEAKQRAQKEVTVHVVTPTYRRPEQVAELTRLAQTLALAEGPVHWIVAVDSSDCEKTVSQLLNRFFGRSGNTYNSLVSYTMISAPMPARFRQAESVRRIGLPRGVAGRRAALKWIRRNVSPSDGGVLYFADDDNAYDADIFEEVRRTRSVSMFPVGLLRPTGVRAPLVDAKGKVVGFFGEQRPRRMFPVDMAGFAVALKLLHDNPDGNMPYRATHEEDGFLRSLNIGYSDIQPLASNCTQILVWHTMTAAPEAVSFKPPKMDSFVNLDELLLTMERSGVASLDEARSRVAPMCVGVGMCAN